MRGFLSGIWLLLPLFWLVWARRGLPGPAILFPRGPISGHSSPKIPPVVWVILSGLILWATVLVWPPQPPIRNSSILLVDNSSSMSEPAIEANAKIGTRLGLGTGILESYLSLLPETDLVGLVRFSSMPRVLAPLTRDRREVARLLSRITPEKTPLDAQTNLVDALVEGLTRVLAVPSRKQRIILWTDGEANVRANASGWSLNTAAEAIRAFGVELVIVDGGPLLEDLDGEKRTRQAEAKALLADLAKASGGKFLGPSDPIPLPLSDSSREPWAVLSPVFRMFSGWALVVVGIAIWFFGKPPGQGNSALRRCTVWSPAEIRAFRGMAILSGLGLVLGLFSMGMFFWNNDEGGQPRAILVDLQQGMLAGQPTRLEQSRTILERVFQNAPPTCELGLWVMGSRPVCVVAPTRDWGAITDELQRLEAWAEDPVIWERAGPETIPITSKGIWFWDGRDLDPFANLLPWGWFVVDMSMGDAAKAERFGETRVLPGNPQRIETLGSWGRTIAGTGTDPGGLGPIRNFLGADKGFVWTRSLWAMGLVAFFLMVGFPRSKATLDGEAFSRRPRLAAGFFVAIGCLGAFGSIHSQSPQERKSSGQTSYSSKWDPFQEKLEALKGLEPAGIERGARELLRQLDQNIDEKDHQWVKLNFLARAALWRAGRGTNAPQGPGQGESAGQQKQESGIQPFPKDSPTRDFPIPGDLSRTEGNEGSRTPPVVGFEEMESDGLWAELRQAQKKVAREVTTRQLGRIILRPWDPKPAQTMPNPGEAR